MGMITRCLVVLLVVMVTLLTIFSVFLSLDYITEDFRKIVTEHMTTIQIPDINNKDADVVLLEMLYFSTKLEKIDRIFRSHDYPHTFSANVFNNDEIFISIKLYTYLGYIEKTLDFYCDRTKCISGYFISKLQSSNKVEITYRGYDKMKSNTVCTSKGCYELLKGDIPFHPHSVDDTYFVTKNTCSNLYLAHEGTYNVIKTEKEGCGIIEPISGRVVIKHIDIW